MPARPCLALTKLVLGLVGQGESGHGDHPACLALGQ